MRESESDRRAKKERNGIKRKIETKQNSMLKKKKGFFLGFFKAGPNLFLVHFLPIHILLRKGDEEGQRGKKRKKGGVERTNLKRKERNGVKKSKEASFLPGSRFCSIDFPLFY